MASTTNIRKELPKLIRQHNVRSLLDAPCGDLNWMQYVLREFPDIDYVGGDLLDEIVDKNRERHGARNRIFRKIDITRDPLGTSDLLIVRDCLFHLSYRDIDAFLKNLSQANIQFLLTTTHSQPGIRNSDIISGDFRLIEIFSAPFNFPESVINRFDDSGEVGPRKEMCLFNAADVPTNLKFG